MLKLPTRVDNKIILVAPVLIGFYMAIMVPLSGVILAYISNITGTSIANEYPVLTGFSLFMLSVPLAIFLNRLLWKERQSYDKKLIAGLVSNLAFNITISVFLYLLSQDFFTSFIIFIVLTFFGFIIASLITVLFDKLESSYYKSN